MLWSTLKTMQSQVLSASYELSLMEFHTCICNCNSADIQTLLNGESPTGNRKASALANDASVAAWTLDMVSGMITLDEFLTCVSYRVKNAFDDLVGWGLFAFVYVIKSFINFHVSLLIVLHEWWLKCIPTVHRANNLILQEQVLPIWAQFPCTRQFEVQCFTMALYILLVFPKNDLLWSCLKYLSSCHVFGASVWYAYQSCCCNKLCKSIRHAPWVYIHLMVHLNSIAHLSKKNEATHGITYSMLSCLYYAQALVVFDSDA